MGYHVTILRTEDGHQKPISQNEVDSAIALIPGLKIESDAHWDYIISLPPHGDEGACLIFNDGEIWTKNPDDKTMQVMLNLAKILNARVRGDEFETYKTPNESYQHPDDLTLIHAAQQSTQQIIRTTKHKQWLLIGIFILLALLVSYFSR